MKIRQPEIKRMLDEKIVFDYYHARKPGMLAAHYLLWKNTHDFYVIAVHYQTESERKVIVAEQDWEQFLYKCTPPLASTGEWVVFSTGMSDRFLESYHYLKFS